MTYHLVKKHVWEERVCHHHTKAPNKTDDNHKDCNEDYVLETGLVWLEIFAGHADVLSPSNHHVADEDRAGSECAGDLDVDEVAKVLEAALKELGDAV